MGTVITYYRATIPAILIYKKDRIVMSIVEFLILQNIGNWDADGFHFDVNHNVDHGYWVPDAQEEENLHSCYHSAVGLAIINNKIQLILSGEFCSTWNFPDEEERQRESVLKNAFYEGLFASLV